MIEKETDMPIANEDTNLTAQESSNLKVEKTTEALSESQIDKEKKNGNKLFSGLKAVGDGFKNLAVKARDKTTSLIEEKKFKKTIDNLFYQKCETFYLVESTENNSFLSLFSTNEIKGVRNMEPNTIYIKENESLFEKLKAGMKICAKSDNAIFEILEKDIFTPIEYPILVDELSFPVKCYKLVVRYSERENPAPAFQTIHNHIEQNVNIQGDGNQVNQNAAIEQQLAQIEKEINNVKGIFSSVKKKTAQELFGSFKNCILAHQKDESLFKKFLTVLKELSLSVAIALAQTLINQI